MFGRLATCAIGTRSFSGIEGELGVEVLVDRDLRRHHEQRRAVGRALGDTVHADVGGRAGDVLDDDARVPQRGEAIGHDAADDIGGAAGRVGDDQLDGADAGRIGALRDGGPRQERKCCRGQSLRNAAPGNLHFVPSSLICCGGQLLNFVNREITVNLDILETGSRHELLAPCGTISRLGGRRSGKRNRDIFPSVQGRSWRRTGSATAGHDEESVVASYPAPVGRPGRERVMACREQRSGDDAPLVNAAGLTPRRCMAILFCRDFVICVIPRN